MRTLLVSFIVISVSGCTCGTGSSLRVGGMGMDSGVADAGHDAWFDLQVQRYTDKKRTPADDDTKLWKGSFETVATLRIPRQVFWPVPNVDSVLVAFQRDAEPRGTEDERRRTFAIVDAAFQQRRKMLRQALAPVLGGSAAEASTVLERAGVAPTARGEQLSIDDFVRIARA